MTVLLPLSGQISRYSGQGIGNDGAILSSLPTIGTTNLATYVRHGVDSPQDSSYWTNEATGGMQEDSWFYTTFEQITVSPTGVIQFKLRGKALTDNYQVSQLILWSRSEINGGSDIIVASGTGSISPNTTSFANYTLNLNIIEANRSAFEAEIPFYPTLSGMLSYPGLAPSGNYQTSELQLEVSGSVPSISNSFTLYIQGHGVSSGSIDLYIANIGNSSGNIPLYTQGHSSSSGNIPLYIAGPIETSGSIPLYIGGLSSGNNNIPLYIHGAFATNSGIDLYIQGYAQDSGLLNLYLQGALGTPKNNNFPLFVWSTSNSGIFKTIPLVLYQTSQVDPQNVMNLVMIGPTSIAHTSNMNLFLENKDDEVSSGISLFLGNYWAASSGQISLFMSAPSGTEGAVPISGNLNLYMSRDYNSIAYSAPLFIKNYDYSSGNFPLYMFGANIPNSSISLYVHGYATTPIATKTLFTSGF